MFKYIITFDADEYSYPEELKEKLLEYGDVKYISRSVYSLETEEELSTVYLFKALKSYINDPRENLFVGHLTSTYPMLDTFDHI